MPRFLPFAGLRYAPDVPLDLVIAPPYDVVGPGERAELAARHPANAIHVELPVAEGGLDPYAHAGALLTGWVDTGTLRRDPTPVLYGYRMIDRGGRTTTGVIGALGIEPPGGEVLPHEQTISKDMTDRLELLRASRANLSPIWGLSLAEGLSGALASDRGPLASATDDDGVRHELWCVDDPVRIEAVRGAVEGSPVVIADGHHRYETAQAFAAEAGARTDGGSGPGLLADDGSGAGGVMALVVELADDQVAVGPIHRTVTGLPPGTDVASGLSRWFEVEPAGDADDARIATAVEAGIPTLVTGDRMWRITPRSDAYEAAGSDLDASVVAMAIEAMGGTTSHHHTWVETMEALRSGGGDAAILMRPVTVAQISEWAGARRKMPPKSTYFFPKPRTGMVFRALDP
jgi:uncharacterized protein (DUF1015 family)